MRNPSTNNKINANQQSNSTTHWYRSETTHTNPQVATNNKHTSQEPTTII
eukprot:gene13008-8854_t